MAEGGEFGYVDPNLDNAIDNDGPPEPPSDKDFTEAFNLTEPFEPSDQSTPYHGGEHIPMQNMQQENPGGLPSYEETSSVGEQTPLLSDFISTEEKNSMIDRSIDFIKRKFPKVDLKKLGPIAFSKKGTKSEIVSLGPKGGETKIF